MWLTFVFAFLPSLAAIIWLFAVGASWETAACFVALAVFALPWTYFLFAEYLVRRSQAAAARVDSDDQPTSRTDRRFAGLYRRLPEKTKAKREARPPGRYEWRPVRLGLAFAFFLAFPSFLWFAYLAGQQTPGYAFALTSSPCGQSSCSRQTFQNLVNYNPAGWLPDPWGYSNPYSTALVFCPCPSCRWADSNGNYNIKGYPPEQDNPDEPDVTQPPVPNGLATTRASDFPNPGAGLVGGIDPGEGTTVSNVNFCPGVTALLNPQNIPGRGSPICATCLPYFMYVRGYDGYNYYNASCAPQTYVSNALCFACPSVSLCGHFPDLANAYFLQTLGFFVAMLFSFCRL